MRYILDTYIRAEDSTVIRPKSASPGFAWAARSRCWPWTQLEIDAGVVWYGRPPLDYVDASKISAPLQGHWGTQDEFFKIETVAALEDKLTAAGVNSDFTATARHAFANETAVGPGRIAATQYDPVWAQQALGTARCISLASTWVDRCGLGPRR